mmetsp:Transcript_28028/g.53350  ORF Transcript_28028/g.53350 Transcript_28028/m.53350 type:complete len:424 (-) Transcript_28028:315-1586(-)|eukprot:CAMPEP_0114235316 /NCGR_PEP_ID=MMETSP0058-20121206/6184_1 /TAXON_ID=36894 /ORGANISM="Pyramimonas parkeae, CCMP726" /LENGTH=423 /DNA_ID=CAMNT_0001347067 /DNA_START=173 /DNA_END=1444 /DNA_ORIENTATION=+
MTPKKNNEGSALQNFLGALDARATSSLCVIHVNLVVYALCYWMTQPVLPFLTRELGADAVIFGWLQTTFSFVQLVGGPVIGRVCDTKGARLALVVSQVGAAASYLLMGSANNLPVLFASRLPTLLMHSMHAAQAFVTDFSTPELRALALGRLTLSYGVGMVVGAPLGGWLSGKTGYHGVALAAGCISLATVPLTCAVLPAGRVLKKTSEDDGAAQMKNRMSKALGPLKDLLVQSAPRNILSFKIILGLGLAMQSSMQSMLMRDKFELSAKSLGFIQSGAGGVSVVSNTFVVGWLVSIASESQLMIGSTVLLMATLAGLALTHSYQIMLVLLVPMMISTSCMYTLTTAYITKSVDAANTGTAIGLDHATRSFCGMIAPIVGGYVYREYGHDAVSVGASVLVGIAAVFWQITQVGARRSAVTKAD